MTLPKLPITGALRRAELDRIDADKWRKLSAAFRDLLPTLEQASRGLRSLERAWHSASRERNRLTKAKK